MAGEGGGGGGDLLGGGRDFYPDSKTASMSMVLDDVFQNACILLALFVYCNFSLLCSHTFRYVKGGPS